MKHTYAIRNSILCSLITAAWSASAAVQPIVTELEFPMYGFSDPDPVPRTESPLYPYFRFDGSAEKAAPRKWKAVILENEKIRVTMLPAASVPPTNLLRETSIVVCSFACFLFGRRISSSVPDAPV